MVSWEEWERAMTATGKQGSEFQRLIQTPRMRQKLQLILDQHMTGMVSQMKFGEFLRGFGPFEFCTENVLCVIEAPWFFYFLTSSEAEYLLKDCQVGTYLMRFSVSNPGSFALAFLSAPQTILHVLIDNESNNQFSVQGPKKKRHFETLDDILDHYKRLLKQPLSTMMPILDGYHFGELSEEEAEDYLVEATDGSYLLRFQKETGSSPPNFVLSYRFEDVAYHSIVRTGPSSISFDGDDEQFPNIQALLQSYGDVLRHPLNASELLSSSKSSSSSSSSGSSSVAATPAPTPAASSGKQGSVSPQRFSMYGQRGKSAVQAAGRGSPAVGRASPGSGPGPAAGRGRGAPGPGAGAGRGRGGPGPAVRGGPGPGVGQGRGGRGGF